MLLPPLLLFAVWVINGFCSMLLTLVTECSVSLARFELFILCYDNHILLFGHNSTLP